MAESHRRWVDQLLRPVLPVGDIPPPAARQRLLEALGWAEIQAAADQQALQPVAGRAVRQTARPLHTLARGPHVLLGHASAPVALSRRLMMVRTWSPGAREGGEAGDDGSVVGEADPAAVRVVAL